MNRNLLRLFFLLFLGCWASAGRAQETSIEKIDLNDQWLSFRESKFVPYDGEGVRYLNMRQNLGKLIISGSSDFSVFINHQLVQRASGTISLSLDSLVRHHSRPLLFGIHSEGKIFAQLHRVRAGTDPLVQRKSDDFRNFAIIISLALVVFITSLLYINPKLTLDYFNVIKFLSIQEREETLTAIRTTSSINFVYYFFCSLTLAFLLIVLGQTQTFATKFSWARSDSFGEYVLDLAELTMIVFLLLMGKLIGVSTLARMFNVREIASFQFFNSVRVFFISSALLAMAGVVFFVFGVASNEKYFFILQAGFFLIAVSSLLLFLKLLPKVPFRFSHLFSYLCASEIIPLMILIKVLFK